MHTIYYKLIADGHILLPRRHSRPRSLGEGSNPSYGSSNQMPVLDRITELMKQSQFIPRTDRLHSAAVLADPNAPKIITSEGKQIILLTHISDAQYKELRAHHPLAAFILATPPEIEVHSRKSVVGPQVEGGVILARGRLTAVSDVQVNILGRGMSIKDMPDYLTEYTQNGDNSLIRQTFGDETDSAVKMINRFVRMAENGKTRVDIGQAKTAILGIDENQELVVVTKELLPTGDVMYQEIVHTTLDELETAHEKGNGFLNAIDYAIVQKKPTDYRPGRPVNSLMHHTVYTVLKLGVDCFKMETYLQHLFTTPQSKVLQGQDIKMQAGMMPFCLAAMTSLQESILAEKISIDIKGENLLLTHDGDIKLIDSAGAGPNRLLTASKCVLDKRNQLVRTNSFGTPEYFPPQCMVGETADGQDCQLQTEVTKLEAAAYSMSIYMLQSLGFVFPNCDITDIQRSITDLTEFIQENVAPSSAELDIFYEQVRDIVQNFNEQVFKVSKNELSSINMAEIRQNYIRTALNVVLYSVANNSEGDGARCKEIIQELVYLADKTLLPEEKQGNDDLNERLNHVIRLMRAFCILPEGVSGSHPFKTQVFPKLIDSLNTVLQL